MGHGSRPSFALFLERRNMLQFIWQHLTVIGFASLVLAFVISFFFRTAWGHWHKGKGQLHKELTAEEKQDIRYLYKVEDYE